MRAVDELVLADPGDLDRARRVRDVEDHDALVARVALVRGRLDGHRRVAPVGRELDVVLAAGAGELAGPLRVERIGDVDDHEALAVGADVGVVARQLEVGGGDALGAQVERHVRHELEVLALAGQRLRVGRRRACRPTAGRQRLISNALAASARKRVRNAATATRTDRVMRFGPSAEPSAGRPTPLTAASRDGRRLAQCRSRPATSAHTGITPSSPLMPELGWPSLALPVPQTPPPHLRPGRRAGAHRAHAAQRDRARQGAPRLPVRRARAARARRRWPSCSPAP